MKEVGHGIHRYHKGNLFETEELLLLFQSSMCLASSLLTSINSSALVTNGLICCDEIALNLVRSVNLAFSDDSESGEDLRCAALCLNDVALENLIAAEVDGSGALLTAYENALSRWESFAMVHPSLAMRCYHLFCQRFNEALIGLRYRFEAIGLPNNAVSNRTQMSVKQALVLCREWINVLKRTASCVNSLNWAMHTMHFPDELEYILGLISQFEASLGSEVAQRETQV